MNMTADGIDNLDVNCYAGYRGEETPRTVRFSGREIRVKEIIDRWLAPDHRYFKFRGDDGCLYIIRNDTQKASWELTFFKTPP